MKIIFSLALFLAIFGTMAMVHASPASAKGNIDNKPLLRRRSGPPARGNAGDKPPLKRRDVRTTNGNIHDNPHLRMRGEQSGEGSLTDKPLLKKRSVGSTSAQATTGLTGAAIGTALLPGVGTVVGGVGGLLFGDKMIKTYRNWRDSNNQ
ncbi:hypothetical protein BJ085DRAFT_28186 [Dimargaris cristalligena]|uniref:Glycine zipper domain-containing protein n=1 Tax=Dimargaris cristalligena TaxID=215637 RepID=A0A4P9ZPM5_9FUNG|nr:hypothetical protein BJ085DRAFT_28186 [Dimargaris cristalligena]|eukprot:RKP35384.1 hypothetical protein BJ085DRAFT_28186 [Dimargaris cristalligena]